MTQTFPYEIAVDPIEVGMDSGLVQRVANEFLQQQKDVFPGGQLVARRHGRLVLKQACGTARGWNGRGGEITVEVEDATPFPVYSCGKPMAAVVIAMLESQGKLDISAPIASILSDFGGLGRDEITTLDVLTHRGGIILQDMIDNHELWVDPEAVWQRLLKTPPLYPRGTFAYMPTEYGLILDRLVQHITGNSIAETFLKDLAKPIGLNNLHFGLGSRNREELAWSYWQGKDRYMVAGMNVADNFEEKFNASSVFAAGNPAFSTVSDAASLAAFYEFLINGGRTRDGQQIVSEQLIRRYTSRQTSGWNKSVNAFLSLGQGFMVGSLGPSPFGLWGTGGCFGHGGLFSSLAFGDYNTGLSVAIVTNGNKSVGDLFKRFTKISSGLRKACR